MQELIMVLRGLLGTLQGDRDISRAIILPWIYGRAFNICLFVFKIYLFGCAGSQ